MRWHQLYSNYAAKIYNEVYKIFNFNSLIHKHTDQETGKVGGVSNDKLVGEGLAIQGCNKLCRGHIQQSCKK